ncbi:MAG: class I SAM-dependent methyltransferase [Azonexus sp.]|nr:class I SAM-dependent methyltransferase [Azonexus sp.]
MSTREIFRAEKLPVLQNRMFPTQAAALASSLGDVVLVQDDRTGLIFNQAFDSSLLVYDQDYQNEQACSGVFKRHLDDVAAVVKKNFHGKSLIEVGCGKGYFLEHLKTLGFDITGIDPAYEGNSPNVVKAHFDSQLGLSADGIVLRHVLEHIPDPLSFLAEIASANGGKGAIYIEVPCFDWICVHRAWFDIFYEHVNYFRQQDFSRMFSRIYEIGHVFGGQYLYVLADLASLKMAVAEKRNRVEMPHDFLAGVDRAVSLMGASNGRHNAIWGGASKGVIFSLYMQRAGLTIDEVIDINPAKQGRYLAGSGLKVSAPEDAFARLNTADNIFVMNSNYLNEIVAQSDNKFSYSTVDHEQF